jgi:hypothetical protein
MPGGRTKDSGQNFTIYFQDLQTFYKKIIFRTSARQRDDSYSFNWGLDFGAVANSNSVDWYVIRENFMGRGLEGSDCDLI